MTTPESHAIIGALAAAQAERPDLAKLLAFYHDLFSVQLAAQALLPARAEPDPHSVRQRAEAGLPQLSFVQLGVEAASFGTLVARVLDVLERHNKGLALPARESLSTDLVQRARHLFTSRPMLTAPDDSEPDLLSEDACSERLLEQAIALALVPYLQSAAQALRPMLEGVPWGRPVCPVCGGQPNLALLEAERGARKLVCARCDFVWNYTRIGCPYCRSQEKQTYFLGEGAPYRLYVCPTCNHYLKTVDSREAGRPVVPALERLLSVHMDLAARQKGYVG